jgi:hypothetical protein
MPNPKGRPALAAFLLAKKDAPSWRSPNLPQLKPRSFADEPIVNDAVAHEGRGDHFGRPLTPPLPPIHLNPH